MKKVFAVGVATMLMMGTASQAMASFELNNYVLSFFNNTGEGADEAAFDLSSMLTQADFSKTNQSLGFVNLSSVSNWLDNDYTYIGLFNNAPVNEDTWEYRITVGINEKTINYDHDGGKIYDPVYGLFTDTYKAYRDADTDDNGQVSLSSKADGSFSQLLNQNTGTYGGLLKSASALKLPVGAELLDDGEVTFYLYQFYTALDGENFNTYLQNDTYLASITLQADGELIVNAGTAAVPVPGASLLLGSSLLGLAGLRRRQG